MAEFYTIWWLSYLLAGRRLSSWPNIGMFIHWSFCVSCQRHAFTRFLEGVSLLILSVPCHTKCILLLPQLCNGGVIHWQSLFLLFISKVERIISNNINIFIYKSSSLHPEEGLDFDNLRNFHSGKLHDTQFVGFQIAEWIGINIIFPND